jgi:DNA-binding winged helix-turn-helix (wHTH) protein
MACSFYFETWRERGEISPRDEVAIKHRFADQVVPHLERIWRKYLTPQEKAGLLAVARGNRPSDKLSVGRLAQKGYVVDGHVFSSALTSFALRKEAEGEELPRPSVSREPVARGIWVDKKAGDVWVDGNRLPPLTNLEYKLLLCLYDNVDCICDKYDIVEGVWGGSYVEDVDDSRIAKLVSRLRERVEPDLANPRYIVTVHGRGYRLVSGEVQKQTRPQKEEHSL